ncbi:hypothetical protein [Desulfofundulus thermobenzoicus]|nr:hypothetical protein [Desulfofundulus thermobenzoicus]
MTYKDGVSPSRFAVSAPVLPNAVYIQLEAVRFRVEVHGAGGITAGNLP